MRLRVGAALCLFLAFWGSGCRKALAPTTLDNQPPETWIVAAPQDTITTLGPNNTPVRPQIGKIPVRFHVYWAGSDRDGAVVGFYWAVVETLPVPPAGSSSVPSLPGPKARDYHYTTATDSIFIFHASEEVSERQHVFFIYAVDDKGRADPTPARFVFSSYDRFPPDAVIDECRADGIEYQLRPPGMPGVDPIQKTYFVHDFYENSNDHAFPRDTVMSNARLHMRWHGVPTIPTTIVTGYRYKLDELYFNTVDSSVHEVSYNTGVGTDKVNPGPKIFTLRAIGQSGWRGESTRWFQMNFAPDTWFSGPDPSDPAAGWLTQAMPYGGKYLDYQFTGWGAFNGVPNTMLTRDSLNTMPAYRPERRSFFEIYNDRLWVRQENDTVHLNSWVIIPAGGFDKDSPYAVKVNVPLLPDSLKGFPVYQPGPPNGSPIGFRIKVQMKDALGGITQPSETTTYPVVDPASVFHQPVINGYWGLNSAGRAYAVIRAEDGDGTVDRRVDHQPGEAVGIADRVDAGGGSAEDRALRSKVLTFYVNHAPLFNRTAQFYPRPGVTLPRNIPTGVATVWNLPASDDDYLDPTRFNKVGGTPAEYGAIMRVKITILGKLAGTSRDTCFIGPEYPYPLANGIISFTIPNYIAQGPVTVRLRLCDCSQCDPRGPTVTCPYPSAEVSASQGTCVDTDIPCQLAPPQSPAGVLGDNNGTTPTPPGSTSDRGRRQP